MPKCLFVSNLPIKPYVMQTFFKSKVCATKLLQRGTFCGKKLANRLNSHMKQKNVTLISEVLELTRKLQMWGAESMSEYGTFLIELHFSDPNLHISGENWNFLEICTIREIGSE